MARFLGADPSMALTELSDLSRGLKGILICSKIFYLNII